jgi:hypothetical protein
MNHAAWYGICRAALLECDPAKVPTRIREAETAISVRMQGFAQDSDSCHERQLISDVLSRLRTLQKPLQRHL